MNGRVRERKGKTYILKTTRDEQDRVSFLHLFFPHQVMVMMERVIRCQRDFGVPLALEVSVSTTVISLFVCCNNMDVCAWNRYIPTILYLCLLFVVLLMMFLRCEM